MDNTAKDKSYLGSGLKFPIQVNRATGRAVMSHGEQSVKESVYIILMTQKGERFARRDFGSRLLSYTFMDTSVTRININAPEMAGRYRLSAGDIRCVFDMAGGIAKSFGREDIVTEDIVMAVKSCNGKSLGEYADALKTNIRWQELVVDEDTMTQLRYIENRLKYKNTVDGKWGFDRKVSYGKGTCALFYGPAGTGKTMAAKVLANELGLALYRVDLSRMVSKYIGETQKHISALFEHAKSTNALLFFDEADALFAKRTEVGDSHDRNANSEVAHLLQKLEEYDGISILATNLKDNIVAALFS